MPEPKPTIGRIVHYVDHCKEGGTYCRAAIITSIDRENEKVSLTVFYRDNEPSIEQKVCQGKNSNEMFTWHWPERKEN